MKYLAIAITSLLTACGGTVCDYEEVRTRVIKNGEQYWERCWRETCPNSATITLRCERVD